MTDVSPTNSPLPASRRRRVLFAVAALLLGWAVAELAAFSYLRLAGVGGQSRAQMQAARDALVDPEAADDLEVGAIPIPSFSSEVIHPYLGYVIDPDESPSHSVLGFRGEAPPLSRRAPGRVIIGIFGGSFAEQLSLIGRDALLAELRRVPRLADAEFVVHTLALGGYKQPQQLQTLSYLLALGAEFDVVVNVDGFNEVALAPAEVPPGSFPYYPRGWMARVDNFVDRETLRMVAELTALDRQMHSWGRLFSRFPLRASFVANLVWRVRHESLVARQRRLASDLDRRAATRQQHRTYLAAGPPWPDAGPEALAADLAMMWQRASTQMHRLCTANGITYLHVLQPNQYVPGAKPMGRAERALAFSEDQPYRIGVELGYPLLRSAGEELIGEGVHFLDLSGIFEGVSAPRYVDSCCHLNRVGYREVATAIGRALAEDQGPTR